MNILFAVIGVLLGGLMFHVGGAVSGGIIGWFWGVAAACCSNNICTLNNQESLIKFISLW